MKLKFTPRIVHLIVFALSAAALIAQYVSGALANATPITLASVWGALGTTLIALFMHNVMQPDDSTRNPGLMNKKIDPATPTVRPPPPPVQTLVRAGTMLTALSFVFMTLAVLSFVFSPIVSCTPSQTAELTAVDNEVIKDLKAGFTTDQIVDDVAQMLGGKLGVDAATVVLDVIAFLKDTGVLSEQFPALVTPAQKIQDDLIVKLAAKRGAK